MARIARITGGSTLVAAGTLLLFLPGPGLLTIAAGLALLAKDVPWAGRMMEKVKARVGRQTAD